MAKIDLVDTQVDRAVLRGAAASGVTKTALTDLRAHHAQCEMNYHLCRALLPGLRPVASQPPDCWQVCLAVPSESSEAATVTFECLDAAPYTTTLLVSQSFQSITGCEPAQLRVRLYHDVGMAEVIAWDRHRHWLPRYAYPNRNMYHPDEKLALNRFLGEWLSHCRKMGIARTSNCEADLIRRK